MNLTLRNVLAAGVASSLAIGWAAADGARAAHAPPLSRRMPKVVREMPGFGRIEWTTGKLPFVPDGPRAGISGMGMVAHARRIYVCGGFIPAGDETKDRRSRRTSRWAHDYDPQTKRWTRLPDMPGRREYTRAIATEDAVYVVGGGCQLHGTAEKYLPYADCFRLDLTKPAPAWGRCGRLSVPRTHMAVGCAGGRLIVAGGNQYDLKAGGYRSSTTRRTTDVLDLAHPERGWQPRAPIPGSPRGWTASATCRGKLYVLGGLTFSDQGKQLRLREALCYDPQADRWTQQAPPPIAVSGWEGAAFADRYIIVVGGVTAHPQRPDEHIWNDLPFVYDTQGDRWLRAEGPLPPGALFNDPGVCVIGDTIHVAGAEGPRGTHYNHWLIGRIRPGE